MLFAVNLTACGVPVFSSPSTTPTATAPAVLLGSDTGLGDTGYMGDVTPDLPSGWSFTWTCDPSLDYYIQITVYSHYRWAENCAKSPGVEVGQGTGKMSLDIKAQGPWTIAFYVGTHGGPSVPLP
jgi:hypothetical protein